MTQHGHKHKVGGKSKRRSKTRSSKKVVTIHKKVTRKARK